MLSNFRSHSEPNNSSILALEKFTRLCLRQSDSIVLEGPQNAFEEATVDIFKQTLDSRKKVIEAKEKFRNFNVYKLQTTFPGMTTEKIMDLKAQFQTFDINQDGLIDFDELCSVLDELGDTQSEATRRRYFQHLDVDASGAIDFEEYITLLSEMLLGGDAGFLAAVDQSGTCGKDGVNALKCLSIVEQIDNGIF